jgi:hypothetical protein
MSFSPHHARLHRATRLPFPIHLLQFKNIAAQCRSLRAELSSSEQARASLADELAAAVRERNELSEALAQAREAATRDVLAQLRTAVLRNEQLRRDLVAATEAAAAERAGRTAQQEEGAEAAERLRIALAQVRWPDVTFQEPAVLQTQPLTPPPSLSSRFLHRRLSSPRVWSFTDGVC